MIKEIADDFCWLVQFRNHCVSGRKWEKIFNFSEKKTTEMQNGNRTRKQFSLMIRVEQFFKTKLVSSTLEQ